MMIGCGTHGERISAVVCQHLLPGAASPAGFIENCSDPHDLQAWCHQCEATFEQEGALTEAFRRFNGMTIVCTVCYGEARSRHALLHG